MGADRDELAGYFEAWSSAVDDFVEVLGGLSPQQWALPTDLPGWSVHDVAAHIAHLEHLLAGGEHDDIDVGSPAHVTGGMGTFTEQGVVARKDKAPEELVAEIRDAAEHRRAAQHNTPFQDGDAPAAGLFGAIGWNVRTLLKNRPLDLWMHEQDVRRAVGLPDAVDTSAARHTVNYMAANLGYVLGKKAGAPRGTTATLHVDGVGSFSAEIDDTGRGRTIEAPPAPSVTITVGTADFGGLTGGRFFPTQVELSGDLELGQRVLEGFHGLTP